MGKLKEFIASKGKVAAQREKYAQIRLQIQQLLGWADEEYCAFQYSSGLEFLNETLVEVAHAEIMSQSRLFWKWWVNHWNRRDERFLGLQNEPELILTPTGVRETECTSDRYKSAHSVNRLHDHSYMIEGLAHIAAEVLSQTEKSNKSK